LRLDKIPFYLLHKLDFYTYAGGIIWEFVKEQQDKGFLGHIGVSIGGGPDEALTAIADERMEIIQIPYNIYDWRWKKAGVFDQAAAGNVMIVNRSTYLQGLLVMSQEDAAEKLPRSLPYRERLEETAVKWGCSLKELVLQYVLSNSGITSTILGVDSPEQFEENISIFNSGTIPEDVLKEAYTRFSDVPENVLNPALWNQPYKGNQYKSKKG
ncbi:MAG: aldo/keto reductase, partial [Spirochaetia bacterium]